VRQNRLEPKIGAGKLKVRKTLTLLDAIEEWVPERKHFSLATYVYISGAIDDGDSIYNLLHVGVSDAIALCLEMCELVIFRSFVGNFELLCAKKLIKVIN